MKLQRATKGDIAYGVLRDDDARIFFTTIERFPVPAGVYTVHWLNHPIHSWCYELQDVPDRTGILIHSGNRPTSSKGCIIVGRGFDQLGSIPVVTSSGSALLRLIQFLGKKTFTLTISDAVN